MSVSFIPTPTRRALRPLKPEQDAAFPVVPDLNARLHTAASAEHGQPDEVVAFALASASGYAYAEDDTLPMIMQRVGLDSRCVKIQQVVDAMFICSTAYVLQSRDGRVVVVCYRGTQPLNLLSWLTDLNLRSPQVSLPLHGDEGPFALHGGFYRNMRATRASVITHLHRALDGFSIKDGRTPVAAPLERLYVTGHSLGGAMAALLAVALVTEPAYARLRPTVTAVYTFGQPMVGPVAFARVCDRDEVLGGRVFRYVYDRDVVPSLPSRDLGDYAHFGQQFTYHPARRPPVGGAADRARPWTADDSPRGQLSWVGDFLATPLVFAAQQLPLFRMLPARHSLEDHFPDNYITALTPPGAVTEFGNARL